MFVNLVWSGGVAVQSGSATEPYICRGADRDAVLALLRQDATNTVTEDAAGGARSHCRFAPPPFTLESRSYSAPRFLQRHCGRTPGAASPAPAKKVKRERFIDDGDDGRGRWSPSDAHPIVFH